MTVECYRQFGRTYWKRDRNVRGLGKICNLFVTRTYSVCGQNEWRGSKCTASQVSSMTYNRVRIANERDIEPVRCGARRSDRVAIDQDLWHREGQTERDRQRLVRNNCQQGANIKTVSVYFSVCSIDRSNPYISINASIDSKIEMIDPIPFPYRSSIQFVSVHCAT